MYYNPIEESSKCYVPPEDLHAAMVRIAREVLYMPHDRTEFTMYGPELHLVNRRAIWEHGHARRLNWIWDAECPHQVSIQPGPELLQWLKEQTESEPAGEVPLEFLETLSPREQQLLRVLWTRRRMTLGDLAIEAWPNKCIETASVIKAITRLGKRLGNRCVIDRKGDVVTLTPAKTNSGQI